MADLFRDAAFGQALRIYFLREMAPYEDEKSGFDVGRTISRPESHYISRISASEISFGDADAKDGTGSDPEKTGSIFRTTSEPDETRSIDDVKIVVFMGPEDQDNPQNWSQAKKAFTYFQICLLTLTIYSGSAIITPAEGAFMKSFGATPETASLPLSLYVLGYGIGPLLFSPLSEMPQIGRNVAYMSSFFIYIVMTAGGSAVTNYPGLVVFRFLQGFFGGPVLATGSASAQDLYAPHKLPYAMAIWGVFAFAAPALGPVMSSFAIPLATWRWGMWETLILSCVTFILLFFCLPETNAEYILEQRAKRLRASTGDERIRTQVDYDTTGRNWPKLVAYHLGMPFKISLLDPSILFINLYTGLMYSIFYSFFESFPLVYIQVYGFSVSGQSLVFSSVLIGGMIGLLVYTSVVWCVYEPYVLENGIGDPEWRLFPGIFGAAVMPIALFIFGYASKADINWPVPTMGICLFAAGAFILINVIFVYLPISYPRYTASVFAANGVLRSALACGAIHYAIPLFDNLGVGNGCAILGSMSLICAVLFVGLYRIGGWLRQKSRFAESY